MLRHLEIFKTYTSIQSKDFFPFNTMSQYKIGESFEDMRWAYFFWFGIFFIVLSIKLFKTLNFSRKMCVLDCRLCLMMRLLVFWRFGGLVMYNCIILLSSLASFISSGWINSLYFVANFKSHLIDTLENCCVQNRISSLSI